MSEAQLGKICGCSGLTGGQYLPKSVTATQLPRGGGDLRALPCRCCIKYQVMIFYPQPTYSKQNSFLFWQKRSFFVFFCRGRSADSELQKLAQCAQIPVNKIIRMLHSFDCIIHVLPFLLQFNTLLGFKARATNTHKRTRLL